MQERLEREKARRAELEREVVQLKVEICAFEEKYEEGWEQVAYPSQPPVVAHI